VALYAHIVGWGKYVPERVVTNHDLAKIMDTSDEWIKSRTGISERRFAAENETTATMSIEAAKLALDRARIAPSAIDMIIVATITPDHFFPSTAALVQDALGATHAAAYDLNAACAGFIYGLSMANSMIQSGAAKVVVVIGAETLSRILDVEDRTTYPLFGDGAGAVVLKAHPTPGGVLSTVLGADGSGAEHLIMPAGGSKIPTSQETLDQRLHFMRMNGREVYRFATRVMGKASKEACDKAGIGVDEISLFVPHQANIRIIQSASKQLKVSEDKVYTNLDKYGNTSAASIPIAFCEAIEEGKVKTKDKVVMVGFGAGLTWGATVIEWGVPMPYKRRRWWYRAWRWLVYRWARVRSMSARLSRQLEDRFDRDESRRIKPVEKPKEEKEVETSQPPNTNGSKPHPTQTPAPLPAETEEQVEEKVLAGDQNTNSDKDGG
jgi:3-oxoacyl-[acyl-carrier-protein] synthase-3